ncbi:MAG: hypothetical protein LQ350_005796 [Teloschistes chrysophthalmus]|nr:MAG: hypothetical protein LQ350_005796 [Niorma chrysophthalma]
MCFAGGRTVRRLPNGRLVQERVQPVRTPEHIPTPRAVTNETGNHSPTVAPEKKDENDESYLDIFAGLAVSSSSSSSDSSSDRSSRDSKQKHQTHAKVPVKQCDTESASTSCSSSANPASPVESPKQEVFPKLKKKVSFPPKLTRGKDKSYTPPLSDQKQVRFSEDTTPSEEEKSVRFSDELIRGEGPEYNNLTPKKSEKYPFFTTAFGSRKKQRQTSPPAPLKSSIANREASKIGKKKTTMGDKKHGIARDELEEFDILSDSDSSFTEFAPGAPPTIENEQSRREPITTPRGQPLRMPTNSSVPLKHVPGRGWVQRGDAQTEIGSMESYVEYVTARNTQLNQASERNPGLERVEQERRHGAAPIPDYNSYGYQIRPNAADSNTFNGAPSSRWPLPVFVRRGSGSSTGPARPQPKVVLGERSSARHNAGDANQRATTGTNKRASAGPSQQPSGGKESGRAARRSHQPPSFIDGDVDNNVYYDSASRRTYRDV